MKRRTLQQVIPAVIMGGAAAIPVITMVDILNHFSGGAPGVALQPSAPVAALPSHSSSGTSVTSSSSSGGTRTYQGPVVNDPFGGVQATVTVSGKRIADVSIAAPQSDPRSAGINQQAVPLLRSETLQAQSAQIHTVSGATLTSQAYAQSLQAALNQARSQGHGVATSAAGSHLAGTSQPPSISSSRSDD